MSEPKKKQILVVEDAHSLRRDIVEMLGFEGYDVIDAENGLKGLERARESHPDLIICDIMMPVMDGYEVLAELRRDRTLEMIPFIFLTARGDRVDWRTGMQSGADDYVIKPFTASELLGTVRTRLERKEIIESYTESLVDEVRNNIITAMPHELRTPLNVVLGFSTLMMTDAAGLDAARIEEMSTHIHVAGNRLYRLIENYITYAYTEILMSDGNRRQLLHAGFLFSPQVSIRNYATERARIFNRENDVQFSLQETAQLAIHEEYFKKIIEELVDNACKFSLQGTSIQIDSSVQNGLYIIEILDHGRGMKPEQIERIGAYMQFERHFHEQQGSGLGLIISKRLIELHSGTFAIDAAVAQGTIIRFALPMVQTTNSKH